ncbi:GGDEF domain-containing protein [Amycolatopsis sp. H20-H5]|uniref:GGDEF domain-containing protein n=1 Tax=Amycolatopsis sp. H20-H5 TaxID=3046309 RepID=UPI003FA36221
MAITLVSATAVPVTAHHLQTFAILVLFAVCSTELSRKIERQRRTLSPGIHVNMTSVWVLPGSFLLPPQLIAVLVTTLYVYLGFRSWAGVRPGAMHRTVANTTTVTLSGLAAGLAGQVDFGQASPALSICAAALTYFATNTVITGMGLYLAAPEEATVSGCLGDWDDNVLELSTLCVGGLLIAVMSYQPILMVLVFIPLHVLQRSVLIKQLEVLATTDQKTQLLNAVTWQQGAEREVSRVEREGGSFGALMIDLDFFKKINDTYGHLAGDDVLKAVAALVKSETRAQDLAGRFGGEEFVALLTSSSKEDAAVTAERIRQRVSELVIHSRDNEGEPVVIVRQTASIGVAAFPLDGSSINEVMASADAAVYAAKRSGRNRVVSSPALDTPVGETQAVAA